MKIKSLLLLLPFLMAGCSNKESPQTPSGPSSDPLSDKKEVTKETYLNYFTLYYNKTYYNTEITPKVSKHLIYENVVFNFRSTYQYTKYVSGVQTTFDEVYEYSLTIDTSGKATGKYIDESHRSYITNYGSAVFGELVSVSGNISFDTVGARVTRMSGNDQRQTISAYYNTGNTDKLVYKANYQYQKSSDTDALYDIEKVTVSFKSVVNNVEKSFTYEFRPNIFGEAEVATEYQFTSVLTKEVFTVTNGFLVEYI